jgi:hypothetical protein
MADRLLLFFTGTMVGMFLTLLADQQGWIHGDLMMWIFFVNMVIVAVLGHMWLNER